MNQCPHYENELCHHYQEGMISPLGNVCYKDAEAEELFAKCLQERKEEDGKRRIIQSSN